MVTTLCAPVCLCMTASELAPAENWRYLSTIIPQIHPALRSVTDLKILSLPQRSRPRRFWVAAALFLASVLVLVVAPSPRHAWICLPLLFSPGLMLAFDCNPLTLDSQAAILSTVFKGLTTDTFKWLSNLLPSFITLVDCELSKMLPRWRGTPERTEIASAMCTTLKACPRLLCFVCSQPMSAEVWASLPCSLTHCSSSSICKSVLGSQSSAPQVWHQHSGIISMGLLLPDRDPWSLQELVNFLSASPSLQVLHSHERKTHVMTGLMANDMSHHLNAALHFLNSRLQAGLSIMSMDDSGLLIPSHIFLSFHVSNTLASHLSTANILPLPAISYLAFCCRGIRLDISQLTRVFSGIHELWLCDTTLDEADLLILGSCSQIQALTFLRCNGVTCAGVAALCTMCPLLKHIWCYTCKHMREVDGQGMEYSGWGGTATVMVENGGLDGKWNN